MMIPSLALALLLQSPEEYLRRGDYAKAVEALESAERAHPGADPEVYVMLAVAKSNLNDPEGAAAACEKGLERFPRSQRIASYYVALLAPVQLEAALARYPENPVIERELGGFLLDSRKDDPRTEGLLASARRQMSKDAAAQYQYGRWACLHQKEEVCVEALQAALVLTPHENAAARVLINGMVGVAEDRMSHPAQARAAFEQAMAAYRNLEPPVADVPYQYVRWLLDRSEDVQARKVNSEIRERNPAFSAAHLEEARFLFRESKTAASIAEANLALKNAGADETQLRAIHSFLAKTYVSAGQADNAAPHRDWLEAHPQ